MGKSEKFLVTEFERASQSLCIDITQTLGECEKEEGRIRFGKRSRREEATEEEIAKVAFTESGNTSWRVRVLQRLINLLSGIIVRLRGSCSSYRIIAQAGDFLLMREILCTSRNRAI